jgi:hypothetical protein
MVWVQGPAALSYAPAASPNPLVAVTAAAPDSPLPRAKPAAIGGPRTDPYARLQIASIGGDVTLPPATPLTESAVRQAAGISIASRIAVASNTIRKAALPAVEPVVPAPRPEVQTVKTVAIAAPAPAPAAPVAVAAPAPAPIAAKPNPLFAIANRIAVSTSAPAAGNPRVLGVTGSTTARADFSGLGKLPQNYFSERTAVRERIALAYASQDMPLGASTRPATTARQPARTRSVTGTAPRPRSAGEALVTAKLDAAGWRVAMQPRSSLADQTAIAPNAEQMTELLSAPSTALPFGFYGDPAYGTRLNRFSGYPVMFIRTIDLSSARTSVGSLN